METLENAGWYDGLAAFRFSFGCTPTRRTLCKRFGAGAACGYPLKQRTVTELELTMRAVLLTMDPG
jgi:hypothetical protein